MKRQILRPLCTGLLVGWCLLFLRCETTEKSMVRAVYLAQAGPQITVGLLYQVPEASADASDASAALQLQLAKADTLEKALFAAQDALPQTADYRLCDYLLIDETASAELLAAYENTVLQNGQGRAAAKVCTLETAGGMTEDILAETENLPDKLLEKLKASSARMPRLYQHREWLLLPLLSVEDGEVAAAQNGVLWNAGVWQELDAPQAEMAWLLLGQGGTHTFWLEDAPVTVRRCSVSATVHAASAFLRLDCQRSYDTPQPGDAQCVQLAQLCTRTVQFFWQQGIDLVCLQQRSTLQNGLGSETIAVKNACPQLQADVRFLGM